MFSNVLYYSLYIDELLAVGAAVKAGATSVARYSRPTYIRLLRLSKECTRFVYMTTGRESARMTHWRIAQMLESLHLDNANGKIRKQPYVIYLSGPPGSGKTTVAIDLAVTLLKAKYGKAYADEIVTLNETDEFQSEFRTNHKVVIFDDLEACVMAHADTKNPFRKILDFVNNINKTSLNPNVELKGNVYIQPDLVIITTNAMGLDNVGLWMNCASAIQRRISIMIDLYRKDTQEFVLKEFVPTLSQVGSKFHKAENKVEEIFTSKDLEVVRSELRTRFIEQQNEQEDFIKTVNCKFDTAPDQGRSDLLYYMIDFADASISKLANLFRRELRLQPLQLRAEDGETDDASEKIEEISESSSDSIGVGEEIALVANSTQTPLEFTPYSLPYLFKQEEAQNDPLMPEFLATMPKQFRLVLREWKYENGKGDFVFSYKQESTYHYIVVEVKKAKVNNKQLKKSVSAFHRMTRSRCHHGNVRIYYFGVDSNGFTPLTLYSGPGESTQFKCAIQGQYRKWNTDFLALRCAESKTEEAEELNDVLDEQRLPS